MATALEKMMALAALPEILQAAEVLQRHGLLEHGEQAPDVVRRYIAEHPEINEALASAG